MIRLCVWDFDGTVMDTYPGMSLALQRALMRYGIREAPDVLGAMMMDTLGACIRALSEKHGLSADQLLRDFREEEQAAMAQFVPMDGIRETLQACREKRHWLLTHRNRSAEMLLAREGLLPFFEGLVTSEDGFARKPDPEAMIWIGQKTGIAPRNTVMIGDRPLDMRCGKAAGCRCLLLDPQGRFSEETVDGRVLEARDIPRMLRQWDETA